VVVADASPLIVLSRIRRLELLRLLYHEVRIGPRVRREVVEQGTPVDPEGSRRIAEAIIDGWIQEAEPTALSGSRVEKLIRESGLGGGEAEALALAESHGLTVIVDDKAARIVADRLGLRYLGTIGVVLEAFVQAHLEFAELEVVVRDVTAILWLSPEVIAEVLSKARELR